MPSSKLFLGATALSAAHATLPSVTIAPGVEMPMMAFGTSPTDSMECTIQAAVEQFLALGGRHIDTADGYGSQPDVGNALKNSSVPREEVFITTKVLGPIGRQQAIDKINQTALSELGVDYIDLVLIHFPCEVGHEDDCGDDKDFEQKRLDTWAGLMDLQRAGIIRAAGVSNWNAKHVIDIVQAGLGTPAVNQVEWHLGWHEEDFYTEMTAANVTVMAWSALSGPTSSKFGHPGVSLSDPRLQRIAKAYNASTAEVALRWSTQKGVVPVTFTCSGAHLTSDFASFDLTLTDEDTAALEAMEPTNATTTTITTTTTTTKPAHDASCSAHPACAGLAGDCCPTGDGVMLACCSSAQCSAHAACDALGLQGDCCPDAKGLILECCESSATFV